MSWISVNVFTLEVEALSRQHAGVAARVRLERILHADVGAGAGLEPVVARELRRLEQVGVVEYEALGILVGQTILGYLVLTRNDLADGFEDVAGTWTVRHPGIGDGYAAGRQAARHRVVIDDFAGQGVDGVVELIDIAPKLGERRVGNADRIDQPAAPLHLGDDPADIFPLGNDGVGVRARETQGVVVDAQFSPEQGIGKDVIVIDDRVDARFRQRRVVEQQPAEMVEIDTEIVAVGKTRKVDVVDAVRQQHVVELVEPAEGVIALDRHVPAEVPPARE